MVRTEFASLMDLAEGPWQASLCVPVSSMLLSRASRFRLRSSAANSLCPFNLYRTNLSRLPAIRTRNGQVDPASRRCMIQFAGGVRRAALSW